MNKTYSTPTLVEHGTVVSETLGRVIGTPNDGVPFKKA